MKKKLIYALLISTILSVSACGKKEDNATSTDNAEAFDNEAENTTTLENETENTTATDNAEAFGNETENTTPTDNAESSDNEAENTTPTDNTESSASQSSVKITITTQAKHEETAAEDGTIVYTNDYSYPTVTIEGNEAASKKINMDILSRVDAFLSQNTIADEALQEYAFLKDSDEDFLVSYMDGFGFEAIRSDENVISFKLNFSSYYGGAHGNYGSEGINYNTKTGELISFDELAEDATRFHDDTLAYNRKLAASEGYVERLYSPEIADSEDMETVLYAPDKWYLSPSGLTFISDPYALGPYAAGSIEFTIPYANLKEMGLKEEYDYSGRFVAVLFDGYSIQKDINGDGQEDDIKFYTECSEATDYNDVVHLLINGNDILQDEKNHSLQETFVSYAWSGYALYDMDTTDSSVELVFYSHESYEAENSDSFCSYSNLYRYETDGSLTYLGKTTESVTNPLLTSLDLQ